MHHEALEKIEMKRALKSPSQMSKPVNTIANILSNQEIAEKLNSSTNKLNDTMANMNLPRDFMNNGHKYLNH